MTKGDSPVTNDQVAQTKFKGLSVIEVRALSEVFDQVDGPQPRSKGYKAPGAFFNDAPLDGLIDKTQLFAAIKNGGYNPTLQEMNDYMKAFDASGTG